MSEPYVGEIRMFAGGFEPVGWAFCHGQTLRIEHHVDLFAMIGTTYGGDGVQTLSLPDLRGRVPIHRDAGHAVGHSGDDLPNTPPPTSVNFIIALRGLFPRSDPEGQALDPFLAEIRAFAFGSVPDGWAACDGRVIPMTQNPGLYSLLRSTYGGDGQSTFALPNIAGTAPLILCISLDGVYPQQS